MIFPALRRNEKVKCGDCGIMYIHQNGAGHQNHKNVLKELFLALIESIQLTINKK